MCIRGPTAAKSVAGPFSGQPTEAYRRTVTKSPTVDARARIAVCGGGIGALETVLALRELCPDRPHIELIAPGDDFVYAPMAVGEPFGLGEARLFDMADIAEDLGLALRVGALDRVDGAARRLVLRDGATVRYDAAVIAVGARRRPWLDGALSFGGPDDVPAYAALLGQLDRGEIARLVLAAPPGTRWPLPLYELALLTASRLAERGVSGAELTIVTEERDPLALAGTGAARRLRDVLADRGIRLRTGARVERLVGGRLELDTGACVEADAVVALACHAGPGIEGLATDAEGFVLVDGYCRVEGAADLYAVGDATASIIKQGGLATQQADVAAEAIAAGLGAPLSPRTFEPTLRAMLLTGIAPMYLRRSLAVRSDAGGEVGTEALWWPPTKVAGRYLGPYLALAGASGRHSRLEDRPIATRDRESLRTANRHARELALSFADADAGAGDIASALRWLDIVERLDGVLSGPDQEVRDAWRARVAPAEPPQRDPTPPGPSARSAAA
jgi:sulfide:quinone oxidoreductase